MNVEYLFSNWILQVGCDCWSNLDTNVRDWYEYQGLDLNELKMFKCWCRMDVYECWVLFHKLDTGRFHCWSNLDMNVKVRYECKGYDITTNAELSGKRIHKFFFAISYCSYNTLVLTDFLFAKFCIVFAVFRKKCEIYAKICEIRTKTFHESFCSHGNTN